jgi:Leucine-rich repeat (LRR) protein
MSSIFPAAILGCAAALGVLDSANAAEMNATQFKLLQSIHDAIELSGVCDDMQHCACPTAEWSTMENPCGWPGVTCDDGTESRQVVGLSLNFCGLTHVPAPTLELTSLLTLDLSDNFLTDLPSGLDALQSLKSLYLSGNIMRVLPLVVFELGLEVLHAARNLLDEVPPEIGALSWTLDEINLAYNSLGNISDHFCECESIGIANFAHAELTGPLPMCLGELASLRRLDLSHNSVIFPVDDHDRSFPDLTNCTSLEWLDLSGAMLATVSRHVR